MRFNPDPVVSQQVELAESIWYGDELTEVLISVSACAASYFTRRNLYPGQEIIHTTPAGDLLIISRVAHPRQIIPLIKYWLPEVEVIKPASIRNQIIDDMLQSGVTKITMPGSPLQVLINENFTQDSFFIIKEQRRLLMKVVWYCSLLRLQDKKESILDENDRYLSPDVINHIYRNVSWLDSNSTRTAQYFWSLTKDAMDGKARSHIRRISFKRCYQQPVPLIDLSTRAGIKKFMMQ